MKKLMLLLVAASTVVFVSCNSCGNNRTTEVQEVKKEVKMVDNTEVTSYVYQGTLPAADGPGINYKLTINDLRNGVGKYDLDMTYIEAENGRDKTFRSTGVLSTVAGTGTNAGKNIYQLTPDDQSKSVYFLIRDENTLRLLNDQMEESQSMTGLNYDIMLVR